MRSRSTSILTTRRWAVRKGNGQAELNNPLCICHNPHSDEVIVCDHRNHRLQVYQLLRDATTGAITAGAWVRTIAPPSPTARPTLK